MRDRVRSSVGRYAQAYTGMAECQALAAGREAKKARWGLIGLAITATAGKSAGSILGDEVFGNLYSYSSKNHHLSLTASSKWMILLLYKYRIGLTN